MNEYEANDKQVAIAMMAARIYCEKQVYLDDLPARRAAVNAACALYEEVAARLSLEQTA